MRFNKYLTPEERIQAWRTGIAYKLAEREILPSEFNKMLTKSAAGEKGKLNDVASAGGAFAKSILMTSLLIGAPVGIAGHLIGEDIKNSGAKVRELERKRDYTKDIVQRIKEELEEAEEEKKKKRQFALS